MDNESELLFSLFYLLLCVVIIYPPEEFHRLGLTVEQLFARLLGDEKIRFVRYHQRRTSLNIFIHSCLPAVYFLIHHIKFSEEAGLGFKLAQRFSLVAVLAVPALILNWRQQNWKRHPISQTLEKFSNAPSNNYAAVAIDIETEFRRDSIYKMKLNSISAVIATENWLIKTSLYAVHFAHQSDASLSVDKTDTYNISQDSTDTLQMIRIAVKSNRQSIPEFHIRINALEFRNLEERIRRPITIPANFQFHRNVIDRFIDVFKAQVAQNPIYIADRTAQKCYACMSVKPNIKIHKLCEDVAGAADNSCTNCYCLPMWCVECLARWFAARQNEYDREVWLEQKCTCPMCRAKFCLLDVSYIQVGEDGQSEAEQEDGTT